MRVAAVLVLLLTLPACVERRLHIRTDPEGAWIRVNGEPKGRSKLKWEFDHYGTILLEADLDGYARYYQPHKLKMPWWQYPVLNFFADVLWPGRIVDEQEVVLKLQPLKDRTEEDVQKELEGLARNAEVVRERLKKATAPATDPDSANSSKNGQEPGKSADAGDKSGAASPEGGRG
ncbi:MAG: hypothetical protein V3T86_06020 [Planctomycetota bacterium]